MKRRDFLLASSAFAAAWTFPDAPFLLPASEGLSTASLNSLRPLRVGLRPRQARWMEQHLRGMGPLPPNLRAELSLVANDLAGPLRRGDIDVAVIPGEELSSVNAGPLFEALYCPEAGDWKADLEDAWSQPQLDRWQLALASQGDQLIPRVISVTSRDVGFFSRHFDSSRPLRGQTLGPAHPWLREKFGQFAVKNLSEVPNLEVALQRFLDGEDDALVALPHFLNHRLVSHVSDMSRTAELQYHVLNQFPAPRVVGFFAPSFWVQLSPAQIAQFEALLRDRATQIGRAAEQRNTAALAELRSLMTLPSDLRIS